MGLGNPATNTESALAFLENPTESTEERQTVWRVQLVKQVFYSKQFPRNSDRISESLTDNDLEDLEEEEEDLEEEEEEEELMGQEGGGEEA